jgi:hypothetical protein
MIVRQIMSRQLTNAGIICADKSSNFDIPQRTNLRGLLRITTARRHSPTMHGLVTMLTTFRM